MTDAFRAFMKGLIDYAGLFSPARLDMGAAVREYARLRDEPESWMLGRFIVPAARLVTLETALETREARGGRALPLSVIVDAGPAEDVSEQLVAEAVAVRGFLARHGGSVAIDAAESRLPHRVLVAAEPAFVRRHACLVRSALAEAGLPTVPLFLEAGGSATLDAAAIDGIAEARENDGARETGFKLRCGGVKPEDFPPAERIALAIGSCAARSIPMKFTAGLHHPVRRYAEPPGVVNHGFLNVFGAGVLAAARTLQEDRILECLLDDDPASFRFDEGRFSWKGLGASPREIEAARENLVTGYGSCSFDEPRDDLRSLGMLV